MDKYSYFIMALEQEAYKKEHWRRILFIKRKEPEDFWKKDPYPYRLVATGKVWSYVDPDGELQAIDGTSTNAPLLRYLEAITLQSGTFVNQPDEITTSCGNVLFNSMAIAPIFGTVIPFQTGRITSKLEQYIIDRGVDDDVEPGPDQIRAHQYVEFCTVVSTFEGLATLVTAAATPKNIVAPKGLAKKKKELDATYKGKLNDPAMAVKYENELRDFDNEWLKDDPSNGRLMGGKTKNVARLKLHLTRGSDPNFTEEDQNEYNADPLSTGLPTDKKNHARTMSVIRNASFSRGSLTAKSGTFAKELIRILAHITILKGDDCGTTRTFIRTITPDTVAGAVGLNYMVGNTVTPITVENVQALIGKPIKFRSPMYCESSREHICGVCAGKRLSSLPEGVHLAGSELAGALYGYYFSLAKGITRSNATIDIRSSMS